jgi:cytosine deaminase
MDLILRNARLIGAEQQTTDIGIMGGKIADVRPNLAAEGETIDLAGRLVSSGLIETHIHLDKSCILDRVKAEKGDLEEAIGEVARVKKDFTPDDVYQRARRTLEKASLTARPTCARSSRSIPASGCAGSKACAG